VSLEALIDRALDLFAPFLGEREPQEVKEELREFFRKRLDAFLAERGLRYDLADATVHGSMDDPVDVRHRAEALAAYSTSPDFAPLVLGYKRVANILRAATPRARSPLSMPRRSSSRPSARSTRRRRPPPARSASTGPRGASPRRSPSSWRSARRSTASSTR